MEFSNLVDLIAANGYLIIFIFMIIEGPITTVVSSIFSKLGSFNIFIIFFLAVMGDLIGDIFLYSLKFIDKKDYLRKKLTRDTKLQRNIKEDLLKNPFKNLFIIKAIPIVSTIGIIVYSKLDIKFSKFILHSLSISIINKTVYIMIGYFSGLSISYIVSNHEIISYFIPLLILIIVLSVLFINKKIAKSLNRFD